MFIFADAHLGLDRRNKVLYKESLASFIYVMNKLYNEHIKDNIVHIFNNGDLWDTSCPKPLEYVVVQKTIKKLIQQHPNIVLHFHSIPGNHDLILPDKTSACDVLEGIESANINIHIYKQAKEITIGLHKIFIVPYSVGMLEEIENYKGDAKILFSHFSTNQMNMFAGIVDETHPMFKKFNLIITGDTHAVYSSKNKKFHTCGSLYFSKVDEMTSPNCIPSVIYLDEHSNKIETSLNRISFPELKPTIITKEEEAVDDNKIYVMITDDMVNKNNIVCQSLSKNIKEDVEQTDVEEMEYVENITFDMLIDKAYKNLEPMDRQNLKKFCNRQISIEELLGETVVKEKEVVIPQVIVEQKQEVKLTTSSIDDLL